MNQHLKQAIAAARAGKEAQAKVLLARVIKDEPDNVNAWFLLSSMADTDEQKVQHLEKVLELQPNHAVATQQLAELAPPIPEVVEEVLPDLPEAEGDASPDMFPLPDINLPEEDAAPEDPDEAMVRLEGLAAEQDDPIDELPSIADDPETADTLFDIPSLAPDEPEEAELEPEEAELEIEDTAPEDPDEAMAWLERLAADQGAPISELPSITDESETADTILEIPAPDASESDIEEITALEDPDEAMAWHEQLAADQDASMDELPTSIEEEDEEAFADEDLSWLEGVAGDDDDYLESLPTLVDEAEEAMPNDLEKEEELETAEPAKTLTVSDDSVDLISQAEGDSIPSWLADDEDLISADTLITEPVAEVEEAPEPENLPDWLNELPGEDWAGEEDDKSSQVIWTPGEGDESLKPEPPTSKEKEAPKPAPKQTAETKDNTGLLIAILVIVAIILVFAMLFLLLG